MAMARLQATPGMDCLPLELVAEALKYLDHADLRSASAVSRAFYNSAWRVGLYIHRNVRNDCSASWGESLHSIVEHVVKKGLRLSLSVDVCSSEPASNTPSIETENLALVPLILAALPVLIHLSITVHYSLYPTLLAALEHPAPYLVSLRLCVQTGDDPATQTIPADLLARSAPKLRRLHLVNIRLTDDCVAAFALLDSVKLSYNLDSGQLPELDYARQFPRLQSLHIQCWGNFKEDWPPPRALRLDGLRLRKLTVTDEAYYLLMAAVRDSLKLLDIASIEHITRDSRAIDWADPLWSREDDGPVSMRLTDMGERCRIDVAIVPQHRRWRRAFGLRLGDASRPLPGIDMPGYADRIEYLRMDVLHIANLLMCPGVALRALRRLRVDIPTPDDWNVLLWPEELRVPPAGARSSMRGQPYGMEWHYVDCSALETVTLFATQRQHTVKANEVVYLAHALGQYQRRKQDRAALVLVGIVLTSLAPAKRAFSAVSGYAFAGGNSPEGQDRGLWDEDD